MLTKQVVGALPGSAAREALVLEPPRDPSAVPPPRARPEDARPESPAPAAGGPEPAENLLDFSQTQQALRRHLGPGVVRQLGQALGLSLTVSWLAPPGLTRENELLCPHHSARDHAAAGTPDPCLACACGDGTEPVPHPRHPFAAPCGRLLWWTDLAHKSTVVARLVAQRSAVTAGRPQPATDAAESFRQAVAGLQLQLEGMLAKVERDALQRNLVDLKRRVHNLETEDERLRHELHDRLPQLAEHPRTPGVEAHVDQRLRLALDYIHTHYHRPLGLADVASAISLSVAYFCSLFSRRFGITFHQYLDGLRLAKAKELLADPNRPVAEVAAAVGYASEDWFRQAFKAHTGLSPSAWRNAERREIPRQTPRPPSCAGP